MEEQGREGREAARDPEHDHEPAPESTGAPAGDEAALDDELGGPVTFGLDLGSPIRGRRAPDRDEAGPEGLDLATGAHDHVREARHEDAHVEDAHVEDAHSEDAHSEDAHSEDAHSEDAHDGDEDELGGGGDEPPVIDLRSFLDESDAPFEGPGEGSWDSPEGDGGWRLRLAVSPSEQVEVQLPANFGPGGVSTEWSHGIRTVGRDHDPASGFDTDTRERPKVDDRRQDWDDLVGDEPGDRLFRVDPTAAPEWREIGFEAVEGDDVFSERVTHHLAVHALEPSGWQARMPRARIGDLDDRARVTAVSRRASVGDLIVIHLRDQCDELLSHESGVRSAVPESVHRMRVATRRLRSALATYRPWLVGPRWEHVRVGLRWLGEDLGLARDAEVLHARLDQDINALPEELVVGPVVARVDRQLRARHGAALGVLRADLASDRYLRLLDELDRLVSDPPLSSQAWRRARGVLPERLRQDGRRVRRAFIAFEQAQDTPRAEPMLHEVRKTAKRARYAAESAEPVLGRPATRLAKRMEKVQEVLGESQDSAAARALIRHLVFQAHMAGENCFTFGLVYGVEMDRAAEARASAAPAVRSALASVDQIVKR